MFYIIWTPHDRECFNDVSYSILAGKYIALHKAKVATTIIMDEVIQEYAGKNINVSKNFIETPDYPLWILFSKGKSLGSFSVVNQEHFDTMNNDSHIDTETTFHHSFIIK